MPVRERIRFIREKTLLERQDQNGAKVRAEFALTTRYDSLLSQRLTVILNNLACFPDQGYGELALLCDIYGSDKGSMTDDPGQHPYAPLPAHSYTDVYEALFRHNGFRENVRSVFECGIGTNDTALNSNMTANGKSGASLRVWRDYFINAVIHGADIDINILFEEDRIWTGYMDQTCAEDVKAFFVQAGRESFDLMIDDGLHTFEAARCLFENSFEYLAANGLYVIEDLPLSEIRKFYLYIKGTSKLIVQYFIMDVPHNWNNNLLIIRRRDKHCL
jgi:hypothetical protein